MRSLLLIAATALTVTAFPVTPAAAQSGLSAAHGVRVHRPPIRHARDSDRDHRRFDRRDHRDFGDDVFVGGYGSYGDWGRYNNRSFDPDSFNDWWHERTYRSYPRWVANRTCDRMWWGGGSWRCSL